MEAELLTKARQERMEEGRGKIELEFFETNKIFYKLVQTKIGICWDEKNNINIQ